MRIGIVISSLINGGAQRVAITLADWMNKKGHRAEIITLLSAYGHQYDTEGLCFINLEEAYKGLSIRKRLKAFDADHEIDVYIIMGVPMCI